MRLGHAAGRRALLQALAGVDRTAALAAMLTLQTRAEPWPLEALATLVASADRRRALGALAAARAIAARLGATGPSGAEADDLDAEALRAAQQRYLTVARAGALWIDVRADALEIGAQLGRAAQELGAPTAADDTEAALRELVRDPDPALRRAAYELWPTPLAAAARAELVRRLGAEPEPAVAAAAGAAVCGELAGGDERLAAETLAALGEAGLARVRALARGADAPGAAEVALARCLRADAARESAAALRSLVAAAAGPVRRALVSVERGER